MTTLTPEQMAMVDTDPDIRAIFDAGLHTHLDALVGMFAEDSHTQYRGRVTGIRFRVSAREASGDLMEHWLDIDRLVMAGGWK